MQNLNFTVMYLTIRAFRMYLWEAIQSPVSSLFTHASRKNDKNLLSIKSSKWQLPLTTKTAIFTMCKWLKFQIWEAGIHFKFITQVIFQFHLFGSLTHVVRPKFWCTKVFCTVVTTDDTCNISCIWRSSVRLLHLTGLRPSPQTNKSINFCKS